MSDWPAAALATSSSAKKGLPSARRVISSTVTTSSGAPSRPADELVHGGGRQRREVDVVEPGDARPDGEGVVERVPAVQVVGAIADDEADRRAEAAGQQQREQVAGGVVGPVHVLDDDEGGLRRAARGEQGVDRLGHLAGVGRARRTGAGGPAPGVA